MFPNVQHSNLQVVADSETGVHTNTHQNLLMVKKNAASIAILIISRTSMFLKRENLGLTLGVTQTGFQNQRNTNAPTFEGRPFEETLSMEETARKAAWILHECV